MKQKIKYLMALFALSLVFVLTGVKTNAAPALVQSAQTDKTITVKWTAVSGAAKYIVQYMKYGDSTIVTKETTSAAYQITGLTPGSCYVVKVSSVVSGKQQEINRGYFYTTPGKVTGIQMNDYDSIINGAVQIAHINWTDLELSSAQRAVDGYEYTVKNYKNKVIESGTSSFAGFKSHKLKSTSIYKIQVRAFVNINSKTKIYGAWSDEAVIVPQPLITHNSTKTQITVNKKLKVSWKKINGATGYDIYVSTNPTSNYKKLKSVNKSKTSVILSKDNNGGSYQSNITYYVVVVGKKDKVKSYLPKSGTPFESYAVRRSAWFN